MAQDVRYHLNRETQLTEAEIAMIEAARKLPASYDKDNPPIDPDTAPERYDAMMQAVARRNQRVSARKKELA